MAEMVVVEGQAQLVRAFRRSGKDAKKYIQHELAAIAEPIAKDAERLAVQEIRRVGPKWSKMRIGVTQKLVYVVERQSGGKGPASRRRPNFSSLMMDKAMDPAFVQNEAGILTAVELALEHIEMEWGM